MLNLKKIKKLLSKQYIILSLSGLASSLAFAPIYLFPILFFGLFVLLNQLEKSKTNKQSFLIGWWWGLGYFIGGAYWICSSLLIDPLKHAWLIPLTVIILPAYLSVYIGLTTLFTKLLTTRQKIKNKFTITTIFASFWILFEFLRGIIISGFPWNIIGNLWTFSDSMIQISSLIGIFGLSFITLILFSSGYPLLEYKKKWKINRKYQNYYFVYLGLFVAIFLFGFARLKNAHNNVHPNIKARIVQPSIKQDLKWNHDEAVANVFQHILLSKSDGFDQITHVIWPESAIPFLIQQDSPLLEDLRSFLGNKTLITGGLKMSIYKKKKRLYNSIFAIKNGKILASYNKTHLVPFGEYIPLRKFIPFVDKVTPGAIDFSAGDKIKTLSIENFPSFSPLVCYEIIFPNKVIDYKNRPDLIINLTNDGWFGNTTGPYQHFDNAKLRAVENGIPVIRVANNGITAIIDGYGRVMQKLKLNEIDYIDSSIPQKIELFFYKKNYIILSIISLYLLFILKKPKF